MKYFRPFWEIFADSSRKDPNINQNDIKNLIINFPKIDEQIKISKFLDEKTLQIDKRIKLLQAKKENSEDLRKTLISETVSYGINKDVILKDSGVKWIGKIKNDWNLVRGKEVFYELDKSTIPASEGITKGGYKFFTSSKNQMKWINYPICSEEDIIFSTGGCAGVHYCNEPHSYSTDCWALGSNKINLKYYYYYFISKIFEINTLAFKGTGIKHLQKDFIKLNLMPFPLKEEQIEIANYLDEKTSKIDKIIKKINNQISTLTEFRKTLINDVVTGKIKVAK